MKNKIKKWHIALMSFVALMLAIFTSLFNLKADPVDDETGEILLDNWELGVVFYDSTVDNGKTPLTEINWDASDNSYSYGTQRVITVQINYKNTQAVTTYQPGELEISIPNLIYTVSEQNSTAYAAQWSASAIVGANDATHSGYDWNFASGTAPTNSQSYYYFTNAETIEEKSNFEGSIQIQYTITPNSENPESYLEECFHNYSKTLKVSLGKAGNSISSEEKFTNTEYEITSPNWPNNYPNNLSSSRTYWEYTSPTLENFKIFFDRSSQTESSYDKVYIYDKTGTLLYTLSGNQMAGKTYEIEGNYVKIAFSSDGSGQYKGFKAFIGSGDLEIITTMPENIIFSNEITLNYSRHYVHPWTRLTYGINKYAYKITSLDGLPGSTEEYYWVKYSFFLNGSSSYNYPNIRCNTFTVKDSFPEECIVLDKDLTQLYSENNEYSFTLSWSEYINKSNPYPIYVGYPKSIYNEQNNNLVVTNRAELYGTYNDELKDVYQNYGEVTINLNNFEFVSSGKLYGLSKIFYASIPSVAYDVPIKAYYEALIGQDTQIGNKGKSIYQITPSAIYTGKPMDIKFGDDLLYITGSDGNYRKLEDDEYYFSTIMLPSSFKNGNDVTIAKDKYECELWIKQAGSNEYTLYEEFGIGSKRSWTFTEQDAVVAYYFIFKQFNESLYCSSPEYSTDYGAITITKAKDIAEEGKIFNFAFIQIYIDGILQNAPELDSYANMITKEEIATFDMNTYGTYVSRTFKDIDYYKYELFKPVYIVDMQSYPNGFSQNAKDEVFVGNTGVIVWSFGNTSNPSEHEIKTYCNQLEKQDKVQGYDIYLLLPVGMKITSTGEDIINTFLPRYTVYDENGNVVSNRSKLFKDNSTVTITENWNNTGRDHVHICIDFSDSPIFILNTSKWNGSQLLEFSYNYSVSYDSYLEYGSTWKIDMYLKYHNQEANNNFVLDSPTVSDSLDLNSNNNIEETFTYNIVSSSITSIISTHQDVTKYVKTDLNNYSTGTVNGSYGAEYEYKLRVRTGAANVTNLIIYDSLETAQPERQRWQGELLGIDMSYAENKTYKLYKPEDPNADENGYISYKLKVNPYYSENPAAGNLYNEDGSLNPEWKSYTLDTPAVYAKGLEIKFSDQCRTEGAAADYVSIYYELNGEMYRLGTWGGSNLAGQVIQVPSDDFYLYWHTDGSVSSYYGFSIDSITHKNIETSSGFKNNLPSYPIKEINGNVYPDSEFDSYTHGSYGNNVDKLWHYTYTGDKEMLEEFIPGTDKSKVKSLAFEYVNEDGTPAIIPSSHVTYVLIKMKAPADESITTMARNDCRTQWNALDDWGNPVDFITGINSNVVKVALPNSVDEDSNPSISLRFIKEIQGTDSEFENMKLDKTEQQTFMIRLTDLTANEDGSYNQVTALLKSDQELIISQIPIGTYLLEELGDNYFDFVEFVENNEEGIIIEGVTFERTDQGYIITVSEDLTENIEFNVRVTNEIEPFRSYEDKENKENLFLKNKIEEDI